MDPPTNGVILASASPPKPAGLPLPCALRINLVAVVVHIFELFAALASTARADTTGAGRYRRYAG